MPLCYLFTCTSLLLPLGDVLTCHTTLLPTPASLMPASPIHLQLEHLRPRRHAPLFEMKLATSPAQNIFPVRNTAILFRAAHFTFPSFQPFITASPSNKRRNGKCRRSRIQQTVDASPPGVILRVGPGGWNTRLESLTPRLRQNLETRSCRELPLKCSKWTDKAGYDAQS